MMAYSRKGHTFLILHNAEERSVFVYSISDKDKYIKK